LYHKKTKKSSSHGPDFLVEFSAFFD